MPGLDGREALRRIIRSGSTRAVIVVTADGNGGIREEVLNAGAVGFLQKPFDDRALSISYSANGLRQF